MRDHRYQRPTITPFPPPLHRDEVLLHHLLSHLLIPVPQGREDLAMFLNRLLETVLILEEILCNCLFP